MNERINELALQAMTYVTHNPKANKLNSGDMFDEKFAQLIIRECSNVAWQHTPETEELEYSHLIKDKILAHFGVEE